MERYSHDVLKATQLPWHYIPVWLLITTPLIYTVFVVLGGCQFLVTALMAPRRLLVERPLDVAMALALLLPPTAVIVQHSTVYDGWRHLYFIYPAFLFFAVLGVASLSRAATRLAAYFKPARAVLLLLVAVPVAGVGLTMARMHPHE